MYADFSDFFEICRNDISVSTVSGLRMQIYKNCTSEIIFFHK